MKDKNVCRISARCYVDVDGNVKGRIVGHMASHKKSGDASSTDVSVSIPLPAEYSKKIGELLAKAIRENREQIEDLTFDERSKARAWARSRKEIEEAN